MPYQVNCVKCSKPLTLPDQALGRVVQCRHCQQSFLVPHPSGSMPVAPNPPPVIVAAPGAVPPPKPSPSGRPHDFVQSFDAPDYLEDEGAPAGRGTPPIGQPQPQDARGSSRRRGPSRGSPGGGTRGRNTAMRERGDRGDRGGDRDERGGRGGKGGKAAAGGSNTGVAVIVGIAVVAIGLIAFFAMQKDKGGDKGKDGKSTAAGKAEKPPPPPPPPPSKEELAWRAAKSGNHAEAAKLFDELAQELDAKGLNDRAIELSRESARQRSMADEKGQK